MTEDTLKLTTVGILPGYMVIAFDQNREQVPHLQGHISEVGESVLAVADDDTEFLPSRPDFLWQLELKTRSGQ